MDGVKLHPPGSGRSIPSENPLPELLQTPAGFAILEIQGTIHFPESMSNAIADNTPEVGKIVFPHYTAQSPSDDQTWMKRVYLYIGKHQRLTGEVKKLNKPLAIIRKRHQQEPEDASNAEELEIAEIVHHKIIFSQRPEPVGQDAVP